MKEKMKKEAISRMNILKLHPNVIKEFSNSGKVNLSLNAALYYLNDKQLARVQEFEQKYNALVYHVIQNHTVWRTSIIPLCFTAYGRMGV